MSWHSASIPGQLRASCAALAPWRQLRTSELGHTSCRRSPSKSHLLKSLAVASGVGRIEQIFWPEEWDLLLKILQALGLPVEKDQRTEGSQRSPEGRME